MRPHTKLLPPLLLPHLAILAAAVVVVGVGGCSSSDSSDTPVAPAADAGVTDDAQVDAATDDASPPPQAPAGRRLVKLAGPVLAAPVVVPLFWGDDPDRAATEALLAQIPGSDWWNLLGEYGVGSVTVAPSVTIAATAPATYSLNDIETTIAALADGTHGPQPTGKEIYAVYLPTKTSVLNTDGSPFCNAGGGYHESTTGRSPDFAYSVVPHCTANFDAFAVAVTHELIEAATDPYPLTTPAWAGADPDHVGWRGEVGDLCDYGGPLSGGGAPLFGTYVERVFSNAAAAKGGDPCVPSLGLPYFNAAPVPTDDVSVSDFVLGTLKGRGVKLAVGETKKVPLVLHADRDMPAWQVSVQALSLATYQASTSIEVSLDRAQGTAGDTLELSVTRKADSGASGDVVFIYSTDKKVYWSDTIVVTE